MSMPVPSRRLVLPSDVAEELLESRDVEPAPGDGVAEALTVAAEGLSPTCTPVTVALVDARLTRLADAVIRRLRDAPGTDGKMVVRLSSGGRTLELEFAVDRPGAVEDLAAFIARLSAR